MRSPIAARSQGIPPSATVRIADVVSDMRRRGIDIVDFSAGRAAEHTPAYVIEAATRAMQKGDTHQTPAQGKPEFRKACAQKLARDNGIEADPERELIATLGCKQGLFLGLQATLDPGDEVLVEDPGFVSYQPEIQYCGGRAVAVPLPWTVEALMEKRTSKTRGLVLCSPQNPTGVVHRREDLEETLRFPTTGKPLMSYMWSIGHTIRPNGQVLEGNPAEIDDYVPVTRENFELYYDELLSRAYRHLGLE